MHKGKPVMQTHSCAAVNHSDSGVKTTLSIISSGLEENLGLALLINLCLVPKIANSPCMDY